MGRPVKFRKAIYDAASQLFGERGLEGTSIRQIAELAGVSEAALYRHWKGKLDLAWEIFRSGLTDLHDNLETEVNLERGPYEAIRTAVRCFYQLFDDNYQLFRFVLLHQHNLWSRMDTVEKSPVAFWFLLMNHFAQRMPEEEKQHPEVMAAVTLGVVLQPAVAAVYGTQQAPMVDQADLVARAVCRVLHIDEQEQLASANHPTSAAK